MPPRKLGLKNNIVARLATGKKTPCSFCYREVDNELLYGKLYAIGNIQCHYYCALLASCLIQRGKDEQGLFGFLYEDIITEVERCKKHKCSYCNQIGASLGCSITQCRKQFHLPCGRERNSLSLFHGNYKTYCEKHAPVQRIPPSIMAKARLRKQKDNKAKKLFEYNFKDIKELSLNDDNNLDTDTQSVCVICYEYVDGYPTPNTFWPPCCARDAWFHRTCLQRMALSAGMHYLKCPLCNDKENFYQAVISQGYYVPDRDAAWELEQNAFAEIYERPVSCSASDCVCPMGRNHDADNGVWSISVCLLCGSSGQHSGCLPEQTSPNLHICDICKPAAPEDLENLANSIEAIISQEQSQNTPSHQHGPIMPSRMSLRRTKRINRQIPSCSKSPNVPIKLEMDSKDNTITSRQLLNLKQPKKESIDNLSTTINYRGDNTDHRDIKSYDSPTKILEEGLKNKFGSNDVSVKEELIMELRERFKKPQPLSVKQQIVNDILNSFFDNVLMELKQKEPVKSWCSPKKLVTDDQDLIEIPQEPPEIIDLVADDENKLDNQTTPNNDVQEIYPIINTPNKLKTIDMETNSSLEISANNEVINIDVFKMNPDDNPTLTPEKLPLVNKCAFKFSASDKEVLENDIIDIDIEKFKDQYLHEVSGIKKGNKERLSRKRKIDKEKIVLKYETGDKNRISITNKNIQVKIKWRDERMKLRFDDVKRKKKGRRLKQYVLKYPNRSDDDEKSVITLPDSDVTPKRRKYIKHTKKSPDNLIQTSIAKFFKVQSPKE